MPILPDVPVTSVLSRLRENRPLVAVELRPPRSGMSYAESVDAWIDMYHSIRRLARQDTLVFLTDNAIGQSEEENLAHLTANLAGELAPARIVPFLTAKHPLEYIQLYAARAASAGFEALTVVGGDQSVGPPRSFPHACQLRRWIRDRMPSLNLGGWANPLRDPAQQVDFLLDPAFEAEYYLTQIVSHHHLEQVEGFLAEARRRGVPHPGVFGVFLYRSANPSTLEQLGGSSRSRPRDHSGLRGRAIARGGLCPHRARATGDRGGEGLREQPGISAAGHWLPQPARLAVAQHLERDLVPPAGTLIWIPCTIPRTPSRTSCGDPEPLGMLGRRASRFRLTHPLEDRRGHLDAGHLVGQELGVAQRGQRPDARDDGNPEPSDASRNRPSCSGSNTGWVTANSAPASTFQANRSSSRSRSTADWFARHADHEPGGLPDRVSARIEPPVEPPHQVGEADAVDVEDRGRVGIGAHGGRVAGHDQHVAQPAGRGAEQIAQHAEHVAVAAGVVEDAVSSPTSRWTISAAGSTPIRLCARALSSDVHRVHAGFLERPALLEHPRRVPPAGRHDLDASDELAVGQLAAPAASAPPAAPARHPPAGARARVGCPTATGRGCRLATYSRIFRMCSGVVPQQPPTNRAPAWIIRRA